MSYTHIGTHHPCSTNNRCRMLRQRRAALCTPNNTIRIRNAVRRRSRGASNAHRSTSNAGNFPLFPVPFHSPNNNGNLSSNRGRRPHAVVRNLRNTRRRSRLSRFPKRFDVVSSTNGWSWCRQNPQHGALRRSHNTSNACSFRSAREPFHSRYRHNNPRPRYPIGRACLRRPDNTSNARSRCPKHTRSCKYHNTTVLQRFPTAHARLRPNPTKCAGNFLPAHKHVRNRLHRTNGTFLRRLPSSNDCIDSSDNTTHAYRTLYRRNCRLAHIRLFCSTNNRSDKPRKRRELRCIAGNTNVYRSATYRRSRGAFVLADSTSDADNSRFGHRLPLTDPIENTRYRTNSRFDRARLTRGGYHRHHTASNRRSFRFFR